MKAILVNGAAIRADVIWHISEVCKIEGMLDMPDMASAMHGMPAVARPARYEFCIIGEDSHLITRFKFDKEEDARRIQKQAVTDWMDVISKLEEE